MIPKNIKRSHILKAINEIDSSGVPKGRSSRKFILEYKGRAYPPKYIISIASKYANRNELDPGNFNGGPESNNFLVNLGFSIKEDSFPVGKSRKIKNKKRCSLKSRHNERCQKCKETVRNLLEKIYGEVHSNHKFTMGTLPEHFRKFKYYKEIKAIYQILQKHRNFRDFVKVEKLPRCDFYLPIPRFILEFDESQHFTMPRKLALNYYPEKISLGFDRKKWIGRCDMTLASDNDPPYRDEQRAWYDTLRDFLPEIKGLKPTVRLYSQDFVWCSLDPNSPTDVENFKTILNGGKSGKDWNIAIHEEPSPVFSRIIIARKWEGAPEEAKSLLNKICNKWPKKKRTKCLLTCGGFIQFNWPVKVTRENIGNNKNPEEESLNDLVKEAREHIKALLDPDLSGKLLKLTDYITIGIDSYKSKISTTKNHIGELHIELVCIVDLGQHKFHWTGKSYPTNAQEMGLVRVADLTSHFWDLKGIGKVMVLGCHDLTIFNNRKMKNTGKWRKELKLNFRKLSKEERPIMVLHHPHTTVKRGTWRNGWNTLKKENFSVNDFASAGRYYEPDRRIGDWDNLNDVLQATKNTNSIDFIVKMK